MACHVQPLVLFLFAFAGEGFELIDGEQCIWKEDEAPL